MRQVLLWTSGLLLLGFLGYGALAFYTLQNSRVEANASCAIGDSGTRIPRFVCMKYLGHQLAGEDVDDQAQKALHLAIGAYPTDGNNAREVMDLALAKGAPINGYSPSSGYTPLHEAILLNEPSLVGFLMERGANPDIEGQNSGLSAKQLLSAVKARNPDQDLSEIEERLNRQ